MNFIFFQQLKQYFSKERIKANKKLLIYLVFVAISAIFWFLNALGKEYTTTLTYPVKYVNFPKEKVLINKLPLHLTLKVNAYGFNLLQHKLSTSFRPITFNVGSFVDNRITNNPISRIMLPTTQIRERIARQLSSDINLLGIAPDTLKFEFANIAYRKVPVRANLELSFEKQYMLGGVISLEPDSVIIYGASFIVDSVDSVVIRQTKLSHLAKSVKRNVFLEKIEGVAYANEKISVNIPVEQFTEAEKDVTIQVDNLPDSLQMRVFPNAVKVSYVVGLSRYERIEDDYFRVVVDYNAIHNASDNRLKVHLTKIPDEVRNVRFYPQNVEYIIEKKDGFLPK